MLHNKIIVPRIETHVHHSCNLKCDNCNHFSNYTIKSQSITTNQYIEWNKDWSERITPLIYQLCGGEPTLNENLVDICYASRDLWKNSKILLISNGFFLHKHPDLPKALQKNNIKLIVSIHDDSEEYSKKLNDVKQLISNWSESYNFQMDYRESYLNWLKTFKTDENNNTVPHNDGQPSLSYERCLSKNAKQIFNGLIYKCPPLAYLNLIKEKFKLSEQWDYYLNYKPLNKNCSQKEVKDFFRIREESYCNMCASNPTNYKKPNPLVQLRTSF